MFLLIRLVSSGLLSVPWNSELPARTLTFSFGSGVTFGPDKGTAGGCSVAMPGCFLIRKLLRLFRHAVPGCFPDLKGVLWLVLCAWKNCLPDP